MTKLWNRSLVADSWLIEIVSVVLSLLALGAILSLLAYYDGKPLRNWDGITLNTLVSIFATVSRIGILIALSSSLGQWRWNWFRRQRHSLADFDILDAASRGSFGSIRLLWMTRSCALVAIGAWVTIAAVAFDPFVQTLLSYRTDLVWKDDSEAWVVTAQRWSGGTDIIEVISQIISNGTIGTNSTHAAVTPQLDFSTQAAVLSGMDIGIGSNLSQIATSCPSGNCRWNASFSVAICSSCVDVSDQISAETSITGPMTNYWPNMNNGALIVNVTNYSLPNGAYIQDGPIVMTSWTFVQPSETLSYKNKTTLIAGITTMVQSTTYANNGSAIDADCRATNCALSGIGTFDANCRATECALYFCVNRYTSEMINGTLQEASIEVASERDPESWQVTSGPYTGAQNLIGVQPPVDGLYVNDIWDMRTDLAIKAPSAKGGATLYNISQGAVDGVISFLTSTLSTDGLQSPWGWVMEDSSAPKGIDFTAPYMQMLWRNANNSAGLWANLAASMSSSMRNTVSSDTPQLFGKSGTFQTFVVVHWVWISLPCFCVVFGTLFLVLAMWDSHRKHIPLWKSSAVAGLVHGLDFWTLKTLKDARMMGEIQEVAEGFEVMLNDELLLEASEPMGPNTDSEIKNAPAPVVAKFAFAHHNTNHPDDATNTLLAHSSARATNG